jgi:hypothetical protein
LDGPSAKATRTPTIATAATIAATMIFLVKAYAIAYLLKKQEKIAGAITDYY